MIKKILIAVDGSKHSMSSVKYGAQIAKGLGAEVLLYHVVKPYSLPDALKTFAKAEHMATFDPDLLRAFTGAADHLNEIFEANRD